MNKEIHTPILINGMVLEKSKYDDVDIKTYIPKEKHPENKCMAIVDFIDRKIIWGDTKEEIGQLINKTLKENSDE